MIPDDDLDPTLMPKWTLTLLVFSVELGLCALAALYGVMI